EVAAGDAMVERRGDLDDLVVLDVQLEAAADAAVRADRLGDSLRGLVPAALLAEVVLALEHQRPGRADRDAVATVDTGRVRQRGRGRRAHAGIAATRGDGDRDRGLPVPAAR